MKSRLLAACAAIGALAFSAPALAEHHEEAGAAGALVAPPIEYTQWTLDNGLRVIAVQDHSTATVTTSMWYEIGAKLDPEGRSGFAHLFEHILSRKTVNMPYNMIYGLTADIGGTRNASNSVDRTNYHEQVPAEYLETMLWTHRERMAFPVIDDQVFDSERDVVKEELRTRVLAPPYGRFARFVLPENTYDTLPHRRPSIGSLEDLDAATLDDARAFHQAYYGPDTATLIVAGNFEMDELRALVDRYFADIPPRENPLDGTITERDAPRTAPRTVASYGPNVPLPATGTLWQGPAAADPDVAVLEVLFAILNRGENSRFNSALVRSGLAVQVEMAVDWSEEASRIAWFGLASPSGDLAAVKSALDAEVDRVRTELVSAAELAEAKNELISAALRRRETARGRAFEIGEYLVLSGDPDMADLRLQRIAEVTPEDIRRVANRWLAPEARVDLTYERGEPDAANYANPVPMPTFRTLPHAVGAPREVLPKGVRQEPPAPGARPEVTTPELVRHSLSNGIEVLAAQTGDVPVATLTVLVPGGSASDPREKAGLANMTANLADKGTATMSAEEIAAKLESLGATLGASAHSDGSTITLAAPTQNLAEAGAVLADLLRHASYPESEVERERARTIDSLNAAMSDPASLASMARRPMLYGDAPYGGQTAGLPESIAPITREDMLQHRQTWWHPGATQVIITGGISPEDGFALTESLLGDWQMDAPAPVQPEAPAGEPLPARTLVIDNPDVGQAAVYLFARGPELDDPDYYTLDLANAVLGGGSSGRLFEEIRTKRSLSYGAYSGLGSLADDPLMGASAQTAHETVDEVVAVMLGEFARIGDEPLDEDLLARRRLYLTGGNARAMESSAGYAGTVANFVALGIDPAEADLYAQRLDAVTAQAANAAADRYFDPEQTSIVIVGKAAAFIDELRAIRPDVEVITMDELDLSSATLR